MSERSKIPKAFFVRRSQCASSASLRPGLRALGGGLGLVRRQVADRFLERNQALRTAALEAHHVTMLLDFLTHVARTRADQTAQRFCARWHQETASVAEGASRAATHIGDEPDQAITPVDPSRLGKATHHETESVLAFLPLRPAAVGLVPRLYR